MDVKEKLKLLFKIHDLGDVSNFLNIEINVDHKNGTLIFTQKKTVDHLLRLYKTSDCNVLHTPGVINAYNVVYITRFMLFSVIFLGSRTL